MKFLGMMLFVLGVAAVASAQVQSPEIDATSTVSALALVSGSLLILKSRKK
jgi:FtsH-binding integral membrane protein